MMNQVIWTALRRDLPKNERPVTIVVRTLKGTHTMGAFYDNEAEEWYDMYSGNMIEEEVVCWADIAIPEEYLF